MSLQTKSPASQSPIQTRSPISTKVKSNASSPSHGKYQKKGKVVIVPEVKKRRSQSPSRSTSAGGGKSPKPRRRRRTRSRSRDHGISPFDEERERREQLVIAVRDEEDRVDA
jgi:hypothetical protein